MCKFDIKLTSANSCPVLGSRINTYRVIVLIAIVQRIDWSVGGDFMSVDL